MSADTPPEPAYDWRGVSQSLAGDNARLCSIALAADALALAVAKALEHVGDEGRKLRLRAALDAFKIVRNGS